MPTNNSTWFFSWNSTLESVEVPIVDCPQSDSEPDRPPLLPPLGAEIPKSNLSPDLQKYEASHQLNKKQSTNTLASLWLWSRNRVTVNEANASNDDEEGKPPADSNKIEAQENLKGTEDDKNDKNSATGSDAKAGAAIEDDEDDDNDDNDDLATNDEIDDHVAANRKKLWSFWGAEAEKKNAAEKVNADKAKQKSPSPQLTSISNKLLKSTTSFPSREDLQLPPKASGDSQIEESGADDAVLYKPHDGARQVNKLNTHKNENFRENILVPDWEICLQEGTSVASGGAVARQAAQTFDIKNWRNYFSHLSSRFGFGLEALGPLVASLQLAVMEKELNSLYERSYKLYGKSLSIYPNHKRACKPVWTGLGSVPTAKRRRSDSAAESGENDDDDEENAVSISNDLMGNLLINPKKPLHLELLQPVKIKKILIIGVHGFFPTRIVRPLIGAPKGTSLKFATEAEKAVIRYCVENNLIDSDGTNNVSVQKIALEKEGKIFDRVEFFLDILSKWKQELCDADFIFIAAHSQGCVVSIILLAKLIMNGILENPRSKRIGILGMAGVNNGPFYGADKSLFMKAYSTIEHESLTELFELTKFDSKQSLAYKQSMQVIINANVKICLVGSINDQLVPLYSALASHIYHPNIYRACYIDYSSKTPDFIKLLVSLCCQLQNIGYFDNNVIKELSTVLAGPLTGNGHSKIYNDGKVYDLGVKFALDTSDIIVPFDAPSEEVENGLKFPATNEVYVKEYNISKIGTNPFILPWCLRGLLFNVEKNWPMKTTQIMISNGQRRKTGSEEIQDLYELFDRWRPDTKVLKDLKFRLNGLRASKL